ncbi:kyphoscoliosis peptidase-like [Pseudophryne corroboree]|uniref:kyphoscoliosis peptidase-like n=1 Tax=Pseudophryne corroboree TaxID=495146 RepID=UPI003081DEEC
MVPHKRLSLWKKILLGILCFPLLPVYLCVYYLCLKNDQEEKDPEGSNGDIVNIEVETPPVNPERQKIKENPALESNIIQKNENIIQPMGQRETKLTSTFAYPWDRSNLKSLKINVNSFQNLDLHAAKRHFFLSCFSSPHKLNANDTLEQLVKELVCDAKTSLEKTRAIWIWVCYHIEYDTQMLRTKTMISSDPDTVLRTRKGVSSGYCSLFEHMCSLAGIQCQSVSGYYKGPTYKPGQPISEDMEHTWNMVYLEGSWHLLDSTWGAGHVDETISKFTSQYNEFYFLTHPALFIGDHYPEQTDCQLLEPKLSRKQFEQNVHRRSHFYTVGLIASQPGAAIVQTGTGKISITIESLHNMLFIFNLNETEDAGLLILMEQKAKFDIYPTKIGQQILQIYAKRPDRKDAYQLVVDYRIDCKAVDRTMKVPKCLSNPAGPSWLSVKSGLLQPSHQDPVITTTDGCCTLSFTIDKDLKLTASLKSDEVRTIHNYVMQRLQENKISFIVHLPQAGHYVFQIFDGTIGYICNYLIICSNPKVKWPPFPALLRNPVGPNPETEKVGLLQPSHPDPVIHAQDGCCTISFKLNRELKLNSSLKSDKMQTIPNQTIQTAQKHKVEFKVHLPQCGSYVFQIFGGNNNFICNYLIQCSNPKVKWPSFPSLLHNPVGPNPDTEKAGLLQPTHPDPIIHTEDGCFSINFTTDRVVNLNVSLKSEDIQIMPNVMHVLQSMQKHKLELSVRLPRAGSYVLQIFDGSAGHICNYLVTCSNPKVRWPPFPSSLHNPVGPNPETEKAGLVQPSHPDPVIHTEDGCFTVSFALMRDLSIFSTLHSDEIQMTPEMERRHIFQTQTEGNVQIKVRLPQPGTYVLHVNIKPHKSNVYKHQCNYLITCTKATFKWPVFPLPYSDWTQQFDLLQPLEGVLPMNSNVSFKLQIPDVAGVCIKGKDSFPLNLSESGYWEGTCSTVDCKYMYVTITSTDEPKTWKYILQYHIGE